MKTLLSSKLNRLGLRFGAMTLATLAVLPVLPTRAADIFWSGGAASYTTAANWGGTVPGVADKAINDNGAGNAVQINLGDPDWIVNGILAGKSTGNGAFVQNGQTLNLSGASGRGAVRLGVTAGRSGAYTINGGALTYNGEFNVGELGSATLNVNGGSITGGGNLAINVGSTLEAITATYGGTNKSDYTWFEQGFITTIPSRGIPAAGSTFVSETLADHSFTMPASYSANNAVQVFSGILNATITFTAPVTGDTLSLLGSSGFGDSTVNYTVHHADTTTQTGSLVILDWFNNSGAVAFRAGGRSSANGLDLQNNGVNPVLSSFDITLANTTSPVTSIDLTHNGAGGVAAIMAVSSGTGGVFTPQAITGFNQDIVFGATEQVYVASTVTNVLTQTAGTIDITGEMFVGNHGAGIFNMSGGTNTLRNWFVLGRSGGNGTMTMTGGLINKINNGNFIMGTAHQNPPGGTPSGIFYHSGGIINSSGEFMIPENAPAYGEYHLSGTGELNVTNWMQVGRGGGSGMMTMTSGKINQDNGNGVFIVGDNSLGNLNQSGGTISVRELWVGQAGGGNGTYDFSGTASLAVSGYVVIGRDGLGVFNMSGGTFTKTTGAGVFIIASGGNGSLNQSGGTVVSTLSDTWVAENGTATWTLSGSASATVSKLVLGLNGAGSGTLNLDGGTVTATEIAGGSGSSTLNFNGGTIVAAANNANFIHGVTTATLGSSGATINTAGFNVTMAQTLQDGGGALTKNGAGTLALSAPNTYAGATTINAGGFGVLVTADDAQLSVGSANFAGTAQTLDVDLSTFGSPGAAPLAVVGALNVNSAVTVNILASSALQLGVYPVITCGSRTGAGAFVLGSLPLNTVATLVDNGTTVSLNVTSVNAPRWEGLAGGNWDIGLTTNWINGGTGLPTFFSEGSAALFNDEALGTTSVNLVATVHPTSVTVNNTNLSYTLTGSGKISGTTGLVKQGPGTLTIANNNDFTGPTTISAGVVSVTNLANAGSPSPIGSGNLVLSGGTLSYAGPAASVNRGYTVQTAAGTIDAQGNLGLSGPTAFGAGASTFKTGPAQLTYSGAGVKEHANYRVVNGTVVFDGTGGAQTNHNQGELWVGNTPDTGASLVLTNTILNVDSWLSVGRGNGTVGNSSSLSMYNSKLRSANFSMGWDNNIVGNLAQQTLTLNGTSTITNTSDMNLGESSGSTSTILLNDNSIVFSDSRIHLGWHTGGVGTMTLANSSLVHVDAWFSIGHEGGDGTLTVKDNSTLRVLWDMNITDVNTGTGTMNIQNNAQVIWGSLFVGKGAGSVGVVNQTGGSVLGTDFREAHIGFNGQGTYNLSAGSMVAPSHWFVVGRNGSGLGEFNVTGGTFIHGTNDAGRLFRVGEEGPGVLNISGTGSVASSGNAVTLGNTAAGNGTINLNGGSLQARRLLGGPGAGTVNFNGGVLRVGPNPNVDFITGLTAANVLAGGALIDTGTNSVGITQALVDGGGNGGLTKTGTGTLNLNGVNTYTGSTLVNAGTLGGNGTIAGPVSVAAGATLAPGTSIGALTVSNTVTLAANSTNLMELSKTANTNDLVKGVTTLTYGGTLVLKNLGGILAVNDTFNLFDATTFTGSFSSVVSQTPGQTVTWDTSNLLVNGTVRVASAVAAPVTLVSVPSGNTLNLSWPADQLGWRLEVQTNSLATGINTNWVTVPGSTGVTALSVPVVPGNPTVFYRLVFP